MMGLHSVAFDRMICDPLMERTNCNAVPKPPVYTLHLGVNRMETLNIKHYGIATPHVHTPQGVRSAFWLEVSNVI